MTFPNHYPSISLPEESLSQVVLQRAREFGEKDAIVDLGSGRGYTYRELAGLVRGVAGGLDDRGLGRGDCIAVMLPNVPEFPAVFHGALEAGVAVSTLNPAYREREVAHQLKDSGAQLLVTDEACAGVAQAAAAAAGGIEVVVAGPPAGEGALADLMGPTHSPGDPQLDPARDIAALPYSSGTTGLPKGVMLTHRNLTANLLQTAASQDVDGTDVLAGILPFFHIYGMTVIMNLALWRGSTIVSVPKFSPQALLRAVEERRITRLYAAPPIILTLLQNEAFDEADLSSLKFILSGAAPLGGDVARLCEERVGCRVVQGYGLTEASPCTHLTADRAIDVPPGSVGQALPDTECRIVDPVSGADLDTDEEGELWVRGPQVMAGYLNNPEATAETLDAEGFLHTGDIARIDANGCCFIVDRLKELIKHQGFQIAPAELEALMLQLDGVEDAAVIGVPDPRGGEVPKAFVVRAPGSDLDENDVIAHVAAQVAPFKQVREVEFVDALPRTASGKIQRRLLSRD